MTLEKQLTKLIESSHGNDYAVVLRHGIQGPTVQLPISRLRETLHIWNDMGERSCKVLLNLHTTNVVILPILSLLKQINPYELIRDVSLPVLTSAWQRTFKIQ